MLIEFPQRLKALRERSNMTQAGLAKRLGISRNAVNSWEMGLSFPSVQNIVELTKIFHVSADKLLAISGDETSETVDISGLTESQKKAVLAVINAFGSDDVEK